MSIAIRSPESTDAKTVAALLTELGYPADVLDVPDRLEAFGRQHDAAIWVAERNGDVAGLATAHVITSIHKPEPVAMLTVLVVASAHRHHGIGRALVQRAEAWAEECGASVISLTSALRRTEAHGFYASLGYEHTGVRLARILRPR
jgi:GNAT superfamily N-acetyltransferase